ncbi:MAG: T9SS type A sorting domain-containing protein [Candidatus Latescibacteria bacterium]|nr:T9SS type A sorting domain-containing protein [Candidatus Latescibacterota bacterium]
MNRLVRRSLCPAVGVISLLCLAPGRPHAAAPGDVYYSAHVVQTFRYYVMANDFVTWADSIYQGTSFFHTIENDTITPNATADISTVLDANDTGAFSIDMGSELSAEARVGIFHKTYSDLEVSIYIRGSTGTPFDITLDIAATLEASREGGVDGTLQDVNGISTAALEESTLTVANGGTESLPFDRFELFSGTTTTEVVVNNETYSLAHTFNLNAFTSVSQNLCILGCMTEPAQFLALVSSRIRINTYPGGAPSSIRGTPSPMVLTAAPNPWSGSTVVSFQAPQGTPTTVDVFDVRGRRVARLFDAPATGAVQSLPWRATNLASGVYFLRAQGGRMRSTKKLMLLK